MRRWGKRALWAIAAVGLGLFVTNSSWFAARSGRGPRWIAHRGVHQTFSLDGVDSETCTAQRIRPPTHGFLENTLASMAAAFDAGATAVELDLHESRDGYFVVFHDHMLECRTEAHGAPESLPLAELQQLDVGYGYTADGGQSYPLRGKGVGLMPELGQVLRAFPDKMLILHLKMDIEEHGVHLADILEGMTPERRAQIVVYGAFRPLQVVRERVPDVRTFEPGQVKDCLLRYLLTGWLGRVPEACRDTFVMVPISHAHWMWGWPRRFERRMESAGSDVVLVGPYEGSRHLAGVDESPWFERVPEDFGGYVWTNRIEVAPVGKMGEDPGAQNGRGERF